MVEERENREQQQGEANDDGGADLHKRFCCGGLGEEGSEDLRAVCR